jgi:DNA-binding IclR family transcriptional regulator
MFHDADLRGAEGGAGRADGVQSIARAAAILRALAGAEPKGLGLGAIAAASGLAKPTARRLLLGLMAAGLAEQEDDGPYHLGHEAHALGIAAEARFGVHALAADALGRLAERSGDTAFLTVRRRCDTLCLQREEGRFPIRSHVLGPGDRHPFGAGAASIAMLAAMPEDEAEALIAACAPRLAASYPRLSPDTVRALVAEARGAGYGLNPGLVFEGSWGVAVALRDRRRRVIAALTIAAIESRLRLPDRQRAVASLLQDEARGIEEALRRGPRAAVTAPPRDS